MFGFGKKKKKLKALDAREQAEQQSQPANATNPEDTNPKKKKKKNRVDKLIMGTILGVAIGSVVGMSMKPKDGNDDKDPKQTTINDTVDEQEYQPKSRIGRFLKALFSKKKKKKKELTKAHRYKRIPHEYE